MLDSVEGGGEIQLDEADWLGWRRGEEFDGVSLEGEEGVTASGTLAEAVDISGESGVAGEGVAEPELEGLGRDLGEGDGSPAGWLLRWRMALGNGPDPGSLQSRREGGLADAEVEELGQRSCDDVGELVSDL